MPARQPSFRATANAAVAEYTYPRPGRTSTERRRSRHPAVTVHVRRAVAARKREGRTLVHARALRPLSGREGVGAMRGTRRKRTRQGLLDARPDQVALDHDAIEFHAFQRRATALLETLRALLQGRGRRVCCRIAPHDHHGLAPGRLGRDYWCLSSGCDADKRKSQRGEEVRPSQPAGLRPQRAPGGRSRDRRHRAIDRNRALRSRPASGRGSERGDRSRAS